MKTRNRRHKRLGYQLKTRYKKSLRQSLINELLLLTNKDIDVLVDNLPMITNQDRLLAESENIEDAMLNTTNSGNDVLVPNGYISVSVLLLNLIRFSRSNLTKDSYIYPALFCFRHYLEIIMKAAILRYRNRDLIPYEGESSIKTHDLDELWKKLSMHIQRDEEVDIIGQMVHELNEVDNDSTTFRYDYKLNHIVKAKNQKQLHQLLDLDVLKIRILQLYRFFDGLDDDSRIH